MQRFVLALVFAAAIAAVVAFVLSRASRAVQQGDLSGAITRRTSMQKVSFFLLICLMVYVSLSGAG